MAERRKRLTMRILRGIQTACSQLEADDPEVIPAASYKKQLEAHAEVMDALVWVNGEIARREARLKKRQAKVSEAKP